METETKEVYFDEYCKKCKHLLKDDEDEPCCECLEEPYNLHSHKPVRFEEKEGKK